MTLQWCALGISTFFALLRLPGAWRGENRGITAALILLSLSTALSIPFFYLPMDALLGGVNVANLILRYLLFAVLLILGVKTAVAFGAQRAAWLISGPVGWVVLAAAVVAVAVFYALAELPESSTGLLAYGDQREVEAYGDIARIYQGFIGACLVPSLFACTADSGRRPDIRMSAGLLALGFLAIVIYTVQSLAVLDLDTGIWNLVVPYSAVILVSLGLALIWSSRRREKRQPLAGSLAKVSRPR